jgi:PAS domain S-box-containing protein
MREHFSTQLMVGAVLLILATTLSAGLPAYWLTSSQLEAQTWSRMESARTTTQSLLEAESIQLQDSLLLFVERPTLRQLLAENRLQVLEEYIDNFSRRSGIDLLLLCDSSGSVIAGDLRLGPCPQQPTSQSTARYATLEGRPLLLTVQTVATEPDGTEDGWQVAIAAMWLDDAFLRELATTTGVEQSILTQDGTILASTLPERDQVVESASLPQLLAVPLSSPMPSPVRYTYHSGDTPYFALLTPLVASDNSVAFVSEIALSVEVLERTKQRATGILFASTGAIAMLSVILGIYSIRRLTKPLQELTEAAEAMAVGHLTATIPTYQSPHEVFTLARALAASQQSLLAALGEHSLARDWLLTLIQSLVEGVITLDSEGRITFFSQGAENLTGWSSSEAIGQSVDVIFPTAHAEDGRFRQAIPAPGQRRRLEVLHRNGGVMALAITGTRLTPPTVQSGSGNSLQIALVLRDVTGEEMLDQMHSYFLANLTHEFQTPLSTLRASLELLMENADDLSTDELRTLLRPAHLSLLGLQNLVNNLLASSAIEAGRFELRLRPSDLRQIISDSLQLVQPLFERRGQSCTPHEDSAILSHPQIQTDPARLTLAMVNLLTNASKYSPDGTIIDLSVTESKDAEGNVVVRVAVADRGPGVPPEAQTQLFNRFARLDAPEGDQASTGLGLFVVKITVEAHGGRVGIEERAGGGSIFWFEIPRLAQEEIHENSDRGRRPRPIRHPSFYSSPRRLRGRSRI